MSCSNCPNGCDDYFCRCDCGSSGTPCNGCPSCASPALPNPDQMDFGGAFDGFVVSSDADPGL